MELSDTERFLINEIHTIDGYIEQIDRQIRDLEREREGHRAERASTLGHLGERLSVDDGDELLEVMATAATFSPSQRQEVLRKVAQGLTTLAATRLVDMGL